MMQDSTLYWIWLQSCLGYDSPAVNGVIGLEGQAQRVFAAGEKELAQQEQFTPNQIKRLLDKSLEKAKRIQGECEDLGIAVITPDSPLYPERLRNIYASPAVLYVSGEMPLFDDEAAISMVGTRKATKYGRTLALELSERLARAGALIVSGGAAGIDSTCHIGALNAGKRTVAVLGCGINFPYNIQGLELRERIKNNGALISEYAPGERPSRLTFPQRNRIISGLSVGLVVVEAGERSGSLITADLALEQSKEVFAVPGRLGEANSQGVNRMIFEGAHAVLCPNDVLKEFMHLFPHRLNAVGAERPLLQLSSWSSQLPENERKAMKRMLRDGTVVGEEEDIPCLIRGAASPEPMPTPKPKSEEIPVKEPELPPMPKQAETNEPDREREKLMDELFMQLTAPEEDIPCLLKGAATPEPMPTPRKKKLNSAPPKPDEITPEPKIPAPQPKSEKRPIKEPEQPPMPKQAEANEPDRESEKLVDELFVQFTAPEEEELLSEKAKVLLTSMEGDELRADQIAIRCGFGIDETLMILTELELLGFLRASAGGHYQRI